MWRYVAIFFRNHHWGSVSILGADLGCYGTVRSKNSHSETNQKGSGESDHTPGLSPVGGSWCPAPHFMFGPVCCIHPILYLKIVAPPCGFWPPLLQNPGDGPVYTPITYLLSTSLASCNLKNGLIQAFYSTHYM